MGLGRYNQHAIAPLLIEAGAELNARVPKTGNTALYHAVGSGFTRFADVLIDAGVGLEVGNQHGITPLVYVPTELHLVDAAAPYLID
jgi:ankyrin repeat protein